MDSEDLTKMQNMLQHAQEMQKSMDRTLSGTVVEAEAGGGIVSVRMNGRKEVLRIKIDSAWMRSNGGDTELLEDLIVAALNQASKRADEAMQSSVQGLVGSFGWPGQL